MEHSGILDTGADLKPFHMHVDLFFSAAFVKVRKLEPKDAPKWSAGERSLDTNWCPSDLSSLGYLDDGVARRVALVYCFHCCHTCYHTALQAIRS
jgi:hypothetical protein